MKYEKAISHQHSAISLGHTVLIADC